jgi:hypothetical protein
MAVLVGWGSATEIVAHRPQKTDCFAAANNAVVKGQRYRQEVVKSHSSILGHRGKTDPAGTNNSDLRRYK